MTQADEKVFLKMADENVVLKVKLDQCGHSQEKKKLMKMEGALKMREIFVRLHGGGMYYSHQVSDINSLSYEPMKHETCLTHDNREPDICNFA